MDLQTPSHAPTPPRPVADLQTPGPSSAGAQGTFRWHEKLFSLTSQRPPTSTAEEDPEITRPLEAAAEEEHAATAGRQQPKPARQPEPSSGNRKAKTSASQAGAKTRKLPWRM